MVVGHQAVLRLIYAYFTGRDRETCPRIAFPLHTVVKLTPRTHHCDEERMQARARGGERAGAARHCAGGGGGVALVLLLFADCALRFASLRPSQWDPASGVWSEIDPASPGRGMATGETGEPPSH